MIETTSHVDTRGRTNYLWRHKFLWLPLTVGTSFICLAQWGGYLLVAKDPLPSHAEVAVALQGSIMAQSVRVGGAMGLLQQGVVPQVILSVPKKSYWGEDIPPVARRYLETRFGSDLASRVDFCETSPQVNSTEEEARVLLDCIRLRGWRSVIVVTSDYHTRRAGWIWRNSLQKRDQPLRLWVHGVAGPEFQPRQWWRHRLYAKTWVLESMKLMWEYF